MVLEEVFLTPPITESWWNSDGNGGPRREEEVMADGGSRRLSFNSAPTENI